MTHKEYLELLISPLANEGGGGITPAGSVSITENGTYDVTEKAEAVVAVPPYGEGSVNINTNGTHDVGGKQNAVVAVPPYGEGSVNIGTNGTHDVSGKASAVVSVQPDLQAKSVTIQQNGTTNVTPDQGKDGLSGVEVIVAVPASAGELSDFAYQFLNQVLVGPLVDSTKQGVPKITQIPQYMLASQHNLVGVELPNVTVVAGSAMRGVHGLQYLRLTGLSGDIGTYNVTEAYALREINIPHAKNMGGNSFTNMYVLETVHLEDLLTIGTSSFTGTSSASAATRNTALKFLNLPKVDTIGGNAIRYFDGLTAIRFSTTEVMSIAANAISYCPALDTVIFDKVTGVASIAASTVLGNTPIASGNGYVYVPDSLLTTWKNATNWRTYANQIVALSTIVAWVAGTYGVGNVVTHGGHYWRCNTANTTTEPGVDTTNWQDLGAV